MKTYIENFSVVENILKFQGMWQVKAVDQASQWAEFTSQAAMNAAINLDRALAARDAVGKVIRQLSKASDRANELLNSTSKWDELPDYPKLEEDTYYGHLNYIRAEEEWYRTQIEWLVKKINEV